MTSLLSSSAQIVPEGGGVAGGKGERGGSPLEGGQSFLQFVMRGERAANQPRGAGAGPIFFHGAGGGGFERRVIGQAEVIVGGKIEEGLAVDLDAGGLRGVHAAQFAVQALLPQINQARRQVLIKRLHQFHTCHKYRLFASLQLPAFSSAGRRDRSAPWLSPRFDRPTKCDGRRRPFTLHPPEFTLPTIRFFLLILSKLLFGIVIRRFVTLIYKNILCPN